MHNTSSTESKPKAHPDSVDGLLAKSHDMQGNDIINEWLGRVHREQGAQEKETSKLL